jgi:uncharacterized membrane protein
VTARRPDAPRRRPAGPPAAAPRAAAPTGSLEVAVAHVLQLGTYAAVALVAVGTVLLIAGGHSPLEGGPPLDVEHIVGDVAALEPAGFLWLGILGIVATPALRVLRALLGFARRGERGMVGTSVAVLVVIAVGVVVGVMAR